MATYENLTEPPKGQWNNSIAVLTVLGPIVSVLAYIGLLWLSNTVLSPEDAKPVKDALGVILGLTGAATAAGGPVGLIVRSLLLTQGKIKAQLPTVPENVNAGGDVNLGNAAQPEATGFAALHGLIGNEEGDTDLYEENENIEVLTDATN